MDEKRRTDLKEAGRRITSGERWSATARRKRPLPLWKRPLCFLRSRGAGLEAGWGWAIEDYCSLQIW